MISESLVITGRVVGRNWFAGAGWSHTDMLPGPRLTHTWPHMSNTADNEHSLDHWIHWIATICNTGCSICLETHL